MELAQLRKYTCNNQLQQSKYFCHQEKYVSNMAGEYTLGESRLKATSFHCIPTPLANVPIKYQLPIPDNF